MKMLLDNNPNLRNQFDIKEKEFYQKREAIRTNDDRVITIPVVFNILHSGESLGNGKNILDAKIIEQLEILNANYSNLYNKGVDMKLRFCLAQRDIFGDNKTGIFRYTTISGEFSQIDDAYIKGNRQIGFPNSHYLNIWTTDLVEGDLGYSSFPFFDIDNVADGIVIDYKEVGRDQTDPATGLGKTLVHEVGHWLGLYHTFHFKTGDQCDEIDCTRSGDEVCDTEVRFAPAWKGLQNQQGEYIIPPVTLEDCEKGDGTCYNGLSEAVQNYMDYNFDTCTRFFTQGQKDRVRQMLRLYRGEIYDNVNQLAECSTAPDPDPDVGNCAPINEYTHKVNLGSRGNNIDMKDGTIAICDRGSDLVSIYEIIDECTITRTTRFSKYGLADYLNVDWELINFGYDAKVQNDRVFVKVEINRDRAIVIYKKEQEIWGIDQIIRSSDHNFALAFAAHDKELLIANLKHLVLYKETNGIYTQVQNVKVLADNETGFAGTTNNQGLFSYNGKYVIARNSHRINFFGKNDRNNLFSSNKLAELQLDLANVLVDKNHNFYISVNKGQSRETEILKYRFENNNITLKSRKTLSRISNVLTYHQQVWDITLANNILFASRIGLGISLHDTNSNLTDLTVPNLQTYYPNNWINHYKASSIGELFDVKKDRMGKNIVADDKYLLVSNTECRSVYIYKLNNLLDGAYVNDASQPENLAICMDPETRSVKAQNVNIGGTCNVEIGSRLSTPLSISAVNKIIIKPGTRILPSGTNNRSPNTLLEINGLGYPYEADYCSFNETSNRIQLNLTDLEKESESIKIENITSSENINHLSVVPNPVKDEFSILASHKLDKFSIEVSDLFGRKILAKSNINQSESISFAEYPKGLYIVVVSFPNGKQYITKFIKK
ncbi:zinc-dependent metalloprotease [Aquimarina sp. D1M17]|uniref:zinc-dependent metalloprotease n=1 Tax=Aquimarina acroporae TaxID=2937283 RepID=UPI0020BED6C5|nr:zinc-dependent metalloprotease [Aquimarina acroporae]MCK8524365.1 zinc-dependent metalloprotease [Aquimarina acroporae]